LAPDSDLTLVLQRYDLATRFGEFICSYIYLSEINVIL